jgi:hypothetical protein
LFATNGSAVTAAPAISYHHWFDATAVRRDFIRGLGVRKKKKKEDIKS